MKLIVGLGNPGKKYDLTRHNIGFIIADGLVAEYGGSYQEKFKALISRMEIEGVDVLVAKPQTFMNLSGSSVAQIKRFYKLSNDDIIIIQDDLALPFGKVRYKYDSSAGGHNGMKDIIQNLKSQRIPRIKIGILNDFKTDTKDFVLANFSKDEQKQFDEIYKTVKEDIFKFLKN